MSEEAVARGNDAGWSCCRTSKASTKADRRSGLSAGSRLHRFSHVRDENGIACPVGHYETFNCLAGYPLIVHTSIYFSGHAVCLNPGVSCETPTHLAALCCRIVEIAESGKFDEKNKGNLPSGVTDPLTKADLESHKIITTSIRAKYPDVALVSEEKDHATDKQHITPPLVPQADLDELDKSLAKLKGDAVDAADVVVWIDPLDATKEFTQGLQEYVTVMACIVVSGIPVGGVVHFPFQRRTLWAWAAADSAAGGGVHNITLPGGQRWPPTSNDETWKSKGARIIVSRSHAGSVESDAQKAGVKVQKVTPAGGAGYKVAEVLRGAQDVYMHSTAIKKWDICAGDALLRAAAVGDGSWEGGIRDWHGGEVRYGQHDAVKLTNGLVATRSANLFSQLQPHLSSMKA